MELKYLINWVSKNRLLIFKLKLINANNNYKKRNKLTQYLIRNNLKKKNNKREVE